MGILDEILCFFSVSRYHKVCSLQPHIFHKASCLTCRRTRAKAFIISLFLVSLETWKYLLSQHRDSSLASPSIRHVFSQRPLFTALNFIPFYPQFIEPRFQL